MDKNTKELLTEKVIEKAALLYGRKKDALYFVGGFENFVYGFDADGKSYIVRLSHSTHRTLDEIKAEMDFLFYLAHNGANVSMPIKTVSGQLVESIGCWDGSQFIVCAFTKAEGEVPTRQNVNKRMFYNYGKTIGFFHRLTKEYREGEGIQRRLDWNQDLMIVNADKYLPESEHVIVERLYEIVSEIRLLDKNRDNYGLIHTDIHMGNFFVKDDDLMVFDFDDLAYQFFVSDIAIPLFYLVFMIPEEDWIKWADGFMTEFMKGYLRENRLSREDYLKIPLFLKLREIILYIVVYQALNVEGDRFAEAYVKRYRDRIINRTPFINLDFDKYYF